VLGKQRLAVHLIDEEHVVVHRVRDREASLVILLDAVLDAVVETGEQDLDRVVAHAGVLQHVPQWCAGPLGGPHRLDEPGLTDRTGRELRSPVACALERDVGRDGGPRADVRQRQRQRPLHLSPDLERPAIRIDRRDIPVDQHVMQPGRRHVVAQRFEWNPVVAGGELQLVL
jgi:hypothetical protein